MHGEKYALSRQYAINQCHSRNTRSFTIPEFNKNNRLVDYRTVCIACTTITDRWILPDIDSGISNSIYPFWGGFLQMEIFGKKFPTRCY